MGLLVRSLLAFKHGLERCWLDQHLNRRYITVAGRQREGERVKADPEAASAMLLSPFGVEEDVRVVRRHLRQAMPWRLSVDVPRALLVSLIAAISYLL